MLARTALHKTNLWMAVAAACFAGFVCALPLLIMQPFVDGPLSWGYIISSVFLVPCILIHSALTRGVKAIVATAALVCVLCWILESASVLSGFHQYTGKLGPKVWQVPFVILWAWFAIWYTCHQMSRSIILEWVTTSATPAWVRRGSCAVLTAMLMTAWDLHVDPHAILSGNWSWNVGGQFWYGAPLGNFLGWFLFGVFIDLLNTGIFEKLEESPRYSNRLFYHLPVALYSLYGVAMMLAYWHMKLLVLTLVSGYVAAIPCFFLFFPKQRFARLATSWNGTCDTGVKQS